MRRLFFLFVICLGLTVNLSFDQSESSMADVNNAFGLISTRESLLKTIQI